MLAILLQNLVSLWKPSVIPLCTLRIDRVVTDDDWNKIPDGDVFCKIFTANDVPVGSLNYRIGVGQIGGVYLDEPFRYRGLEQQLLIYAMHDMKDAGTKTIWEVVNDEEGQYKANPPFYSKLWDFKYYTGRDVHPSVTGGGYRMDIPDRPQDLQLVPGAKLYA